MHEGGSDLCNLGLVSMVSVPIEARCEEGQVRPSDPHEELYYESPRNRERMQRYFERDKSLRSESKGGELHLYWVGHLDKMLENLWRRLAVEVPQVQAKVDLLGDSLRRQYERVADVPRG